MKIAPLMAAAAAALLAGCAAQPLGGARPVPPAPVPAPGPTPAGEAAAGEWRPYAAPLPPAAAAPEADVDRAPLPDLAAADPAGAPWSAAPAPGSGAAASPRPDRPYAARTRSTWGGRAVPRSGAAPGAPDAPRPYVPPAPSAERLAGGRVLSPWADGAVAAGDRAAFDAAVLDAATTGSGSYVAADGEAVTASKLRPSGGCMVVEVVGSRDGGATVSRRGAARACPR